MAQRSKKSISLPLLLLCSALITAPLALGGVHAPAVLALLALSLLALISTLATRDAPLHLSPLAIACAALTLMASLQLIPLPMGLLARLSPLAHEHAQHAMTLTQQSWSSQPLSLDAPHTADRALRWLTLTLIVLTTSNQSRASRHTHWIHASIALSALLMFAVGAAQQLIHPTLLLGFHSSSAPSDFGSTFVNWNHASALYVLAALAAFGIARAKRATYRTRVSSGLLGAALIAMAWIHDSVSVQLLSVFLLAALALDEWVRWRFLSSAALKRPLSVGLLAASALLANLGAWLLIKPLLATSSFVGGSILGRVTMTQGAVAASKDFALLGAGAGATERVIYPHIDWRTIQEARIATVENEFAGWGLELGWPVTLLVMLASLIALLGPALHGALYRTWTRDHTMALVAGLFAWFLMQLHFPLFALGLGIPMLVLWERSRRMALHDSGVADHTSGLTRRILAASFVDISRKRAFALTATLCALASILTLAWARAPDTRDTAVAALEPAQLPALAPLIPSSGQLLISLGYGALKRGEPERAVALLERAQVVQPRPRTQMAMAAMLAKAGRQDDAIAHYRALIAKDEKRRLPNLDRIILDGVRTPELRAEVFHGADWTRLRTIFATIQKVEGQEPASSFALEIFELDSKNLEAFRFVLDAYKSLKQWELVNIWARHLLMSSVEPAASARALAFLTLAESERKNPEAALEILERGFVEIPLKFREDTQLEHAWLKLVSPDKILQMTPKQRETLERRHGRVCKKQVLTQKALRLLCARHSAYLAESSQPYDQARQRFQTLADMERSSLPLARFYARQKRCLELRALSLRADAAQLDTMTTLIARCQER